MRSRITGLAFLVAALAAPFAAHAEGDTYVLTIQNHKFSPEEFEVPAGKKFTLTVKNLDPTPEEFESNDFNREKVVPGGQEIVVYIGPLRPGRYEFFGDFNPDSARGHIIAK